VDLASYSPADVSCLHIAAAASAASTVASTPIGGSRRAYPPGSPAEPRSPAPPSPSAGVPQLVHRLKLAPLTGQVAAWAWGEAAALSRSRRAPPVALLAALWPATEAVALKCTAQDIGEMLEAWLVLLEQWPRHFSLPPRILDLLTSAAFPAAVKRMREAQLERAAALCRSIALHRPADALFRSASGELGMVGTRSARDLMQPVFALVAAELAWRALDPTRGVSKATLRSVVHASEAWRWTEVVRRDPQGLCSLKEATRAALAALQRASAAQGGGAAVDGLKGE